MPEIKLYDYQRNPHPRVKTTRNYFVPEKATDVGIRPTAPWQDGDMFCCYYDEKDKLIGLRFVYADGEYKDLIEVVDINTEVQNP
jgi:hypothetical protein